MTVLSIALSIWNAANQSQPGKADAALVLGTAVIKGQASPVFRERLRHAVQLYHTGRVQKLIFTGGIGQGNDLAEAEVGRRFALAHRVPAHAILLESQSHTTWENLVYAKPLLASAGIKRVFLVSDPLHMRRANLQAYDLGITASPSPTPSSRYRSLGPRLAFLLRETLYYSSYLIWRMRPDATTRLGTATMSES